MKIICIGRNYTEHARELNNAVPGNPVFFMKPDTALLAPGKTFYLPAFSQDIHYEIELVLRICKEGKNIGAEYAHRYFDSLTVGIDFTARDLQEQQKKAGLPWEPAKSFDNSAPVGKFIELDKIKNRNEIVFELHRNKTVVQSGNSSMMLFSFEQVISYVSGFVTLKKGDLIFTGTPKGVGQTKAGDLLEGFLEGQPLLAVSVK